MAGSLITRGNKYYAKFRVNGKQKMVCLDIEVKGNNKRRAEKAMQETIAHYSNINIVKSEMLFTDYLEQWLESVKGIIKPSTWETYDKTIHGKINRYFLDKKLKLSELKAVTFTEYFKYLSTSGKSNSNGGLGYKSVKNIRGVISSALEDAVINQYISTNPVTNSRLPAFAKDLQKDVEQYNAEEINILLNYAKGHESHIYIFLLLAMVTGMRKGELLALMWSDIDFDNQTITINKSRTGTRKEVTEQITTPKTKSSNRVIPLDDFTIKELKNEKQRQENMLKSLGVKVGNKDNFIVKTIDGKPYSNLSAINRVVNRLIKGANLRHCTIHGFRHSVATILDDNGVALQDISILLGHENVSTTENIYIQRRKTAKKEIAQTISNVLNLK